MSTLFSVLVPVYNVEKYLAECIESVLSQTYAHFELILVDDGSTDNSGKICDEYAAKDDRIAVIHQENQGLIMARRKGIAAAKGVFFLFLDSDDYWDASLLQTVNQTVHEYHCDMVLYNFKCVSESGAFISEFHSPLTDKAVFTKENSEPFYQALICGAINSLCIKAVSRNIIDNRDYTLYRHIKNGEDLLQTLPLIASAKKIIYLNQSLYNYRNNPESITRGYVHQRYTDIMTVRNLLLQFLIDKGLNNKENMELYHTVNLQYIIGLEYGTVNLNIPFREKKSALELMRSHPAYSEALKYKNNALLSKFQRQWLALSKARFYFILHLMSKGSSLKNFLNSGKTVF